MGGSSIATRALIIIGLSCVVAVGAGFSLAFAGLGDSSSTFGLGINTTSTDSPIAALAGAPESESGKLGDTSEPADGKTGNDQNLLSTSGDELGNVAVRNISATIKVVDQWAEEKRRADEEAARKDEEFRIAQAEEHRAAQLASTGIPVSDVDFTCGKEAFLAEWTERINNYLEGSPLEGYGYEFAYAAWQYGVDPRWSPAISNTESTKGRNCFLPHNAWGWGQRSWSSWEEAIDAHVAGLARSYGFTISLGNAKKYCPPTYESWYANTLSQMQII